MSKVNLYSTALYTTKSSKYASEYFHRHGSLLFYTAFRKCNADCKTKLTNEQAAKLVTRLTIEERNNLINALKSVASEEMKAGYKG